MALNTLFQPKSFFYKLICSIKGFLKRDFSIFKTYLKGYRDGWSYLQSNAYKQLPLIKQ